MATMIPSTPPAGTPKSELTVHRILSQPGILHGWTIIHSSSHVNPDRNLPREIDFLALVPQYGMLCIEVKGGEFYVQDGQWHHRHNHTRMESPTRQAEQAMYALQHELQTEFSTESAVGNIPAECAVVLTDARWPDHVRKPRAAVIDAVDIASQQVDLKLTALALRLRPAAGPKKRIPPTTSQVVGAIRQYLAPDFVMTGTRKGRKGALAMAA